MADSLWMTLSLVGSLCSWPAFVYVWIARWRRRPVAEARRIALGAVFVCVYAGVLLADATSVSASGRRVGEVLLPVLFVGVPLAGALGIWVLARRRQREP
jgi:hypothetical protein